MFLIKTAGLLLAGFSFASAGIFQRQCYPSTVTVTAIAATGSSGPAPAETTTITLESASPTSDTASTITVSVMVTETTTAEPLTITTTSTLTNSLTVHASTATITVTGLSSSSPIAGAISSEIETHSDDPATNTSNFVTRSVSPTSTVHIVKTMTLVPIPVESTESETYQSLSAPATIASSLNLFSTRPSTIATSSFPTLSVTGTMGITPSGQSGATTGGSTGFGTGISGAVSRSGTGLPFITAPAPSSQSSVPPFANTTSGALQSSSSTFVSGTGAATGGLTRRCNSPVKRGIAVEKRQVGAVVTATIDGVVVSWTNSWDGGVATTTTTAPQSTPVLVTATVGGDVVSWTQTISGASVPTPTAIELPVSTAPALGGPVPIAAATSSEYSLASTSTTEPASSTSSSVLTSSASLTIASIYGPPGPPAYTPPAWLTIEFPYPPEGPASTSAEQSSSQLSTSSSISIIAGSTSIATLPSPANSSATSFTLSGSASTSDAVPPSTSLTTTASSTVTSSGSSSTTSSSTAATCTGEYVGDFTIDFDDLPRNGEPPSSEDYPPLQNPYNNLYWSQGFSYAPPPSDPYPPHSGSQLGVFVVDGNANIHSQNWTGPIPNDTDVNGMFGAGPNVGDPAFYIDAHGAWIGCQNPGPSDCQIQVNGYALAEPEGNLALQVEQYFYQSPCTSNCQLEYFRFGEAFRNLTALQVQATIQGDSTNTALTWYIDDISLAWTDNSCDAVQARSNAVGHGGFGNFIKRRNEGAHGSVTWQGRTPVAPSKSNMPT